MVRMSISVPDELRAKMKALAEPRNWSAIAVRAFKHELEGLAERERERDVLKVITRLDPSYIAAESTAYQAGFAAGEAWARDDAAAGDLTRLDDHVVAMGNNIYRDYEEPEALALRVLGHEGVRVGEAEDWWGTILGDDVESLAEPEFVRGFVEGALAVWDVVSSGSAR